MCWTLAKFVGGAREVGGFIKGHVPCVKIYDRRQCLYNRWEPRGKVLGVEREERYLPALPY